MASPAEERIRVKAEAALREVWPSARIVHELMLRQGGCRIDLAAITEQRLIVVEIKSERDTLSRLKDQVSQALEVADGLCVALADEHYEAAWRTPGVSILYCSKEDEIRRNLERSAGDVHGGLTNAPARLAMLWASELRRVASTGPQAPRYHSITKACDELTGREVRQRVCAALRARPFPRADPPMLSDLFPQPSVGVF